MARSIGPIDGLPGMRRAGRKRRAENAGAALETGPIEEAQAASSAAPIPPLDPAPHEGPPVIFAHIMGQSGPAESAAPANSAAQQARSAYLKVEWSGRFERRTGRGRITKTDV